MERKKLEKFSDRMIGITIASLVLVFSLPIHQIGSFQNWNRSVPHLALFAFDFLMLATCWSAYSKIIDLTQVLTRATVLLTRIYFALLLMVPLSSGWLSDDIHSNTGVLLYALNFFLIALAFVFLSSSALKSNKPLKILAYGSAGVCLLAMAVSYFNTGLSLLVMAFLLFLFGFLGYKIPGAARADSPQSQG